MSMNHTPRNNSSGRKSRHVDPRGLYETAQHYIRDLVYGANDGIITTFAVVAGVTGGSLSLRAILVVGTANLLADGLSMGVGNYLSIQAHESAREVQDLPEEEARPVRHGLATFGAFALAGALPLLPYVLPELTLDRFVFSIALTLAALFGIGAARALVTADRWWVSGVEMLSLGAVVAAVAYGSGALVAVVIPLGD